MDMIAASAFPAPAGKITGHDRHLLADCAEVALPG